jgi:hypothetical protein
MKDIDYTHPGVMHTPRYLQAQCLEALRCDREKWFTRMPEGLFTGLHAAIYKAVVGADDPTDPAQVARDLQGKEVNELAGMIQGTIAIPLSDEGVLWRLGQLQAFRRREKMKEVLENSRIEVNAGTSVDEIAQKVAACAVVESLGVLGQFEQALSLDDPVEGEDPVRPPAIVRKAVYPNGLSVLAGPGGLGKSWLAIFMGLCVAQGEFWLGLQCTEGRVGYVSLEMHSAGVRDRVKKLTGGKLEKSARERFLYIGQESIGRAIDIMDETLRMSIAAWVADKELDLVIVDPLRNAHKQDENSSTEMGNVLRAFSEIGCSVLLIHHVSKAGDSRGSTAIRDWSDAVLTLSEDDNDVLHLGWEKRPRHDSVKGDIPIELVRESDQITIKRTD